MTGIYNPLKGYAFIHVPKCAGGSISKLLARDEGQFHLERWMVWSNR